VVTVTTLYRKWRPQTFAELRGQERVVRTLQNALSSGRLGHAYLFCGPRGVGKTTTARLLAKAVNCLHDDVPPADGTIPVEPDNTCSMCRQITDGRSLDVVEIDAASNGRVDDARDLRDQINFAPNEAKYKFYIIDEAHQITKDAFDALLKTFEEPPAHVIFVLATTDANKVPPTILSRCQRFDFRRISVADIRASLTDVCAAEGIDADAAALEVLARAADGSSRDSLSLLDQAIAFCGQSISLAGARTMLGLASADTIERLATALLSGDARSGLELINEASDAGVDPRGLNRELVEYLRSLLLLKVNSDTAASLDVAPESLPALRERAAGLSASILVRQIKIFSEADYEFRSALQAQLPLELAFLQALEIAAEPAPAPAAERQPAVPYRAPQVPPAPAARVLNEPRPAPMRQTPSEATPAPINASPSEPNRRPNPAGQQPAAGSSPAAQPATLPTPAQAPTAAPPEANALPDARPPLGDGNDPVQHQTPTRAVEEPSANQATGQASDEGDGGRSRPAGSVSLEDVLAKWPGVRQTVRAQSKTVEALLNSCSPTSMEGTTLMLACDAEFHATTLQKPDNKRLVEGALTQAVGVPCYVKCVVRDRKLDATKPSASGPADTLKPDDDDPLVRAALRMLNARVLES
jgi:DNA polymerase III subunit gamma/tau